MSLIQPLAWEPPYAMGAALKSKTKQKTRKTTTTKKPNNNQKTQFGTAAESSLTGPGPHWDHQELTSRATEPEVSSLETILNGLLCKLDIRDFEYLYVKNFKTLQKIYNYSANSLIFLFLFFCLFRAAPMAYGGSQARGRFGAVASGLHHSHSNAGSLTH